MSNRFFGAVILLSSLLIGCATAQTNIEPTPVLADKPNVLIFMFDDLRFDTFSYRGGPVPTPNIDALAAQSTRFDMATTTTGLCSPSRAAFFTGRWGHRTGLDDNVELWHSRLYELDRSEGGIIQRAADSGYYVGYVGKWHLGAMGPAIRGADFLEAFEADTTPRTQQYTPYTGIDANRRYKAGGRDARGEKHDYYRTLEGAYKDTPAAEKVREGQTFLRQAADRDEPFFGVVSFSQPHPPYRVPEPYASMFDPEALNLPNNHAANRVNKPLSQEYAYWPWHDVSHMTEEDWRKSRAFYYGAVAMIDDAVGEIIQTAKDEGVWDDLHVVFIGDQGSMLGEHRLYDKAAYAYDELMRIPLLIRNPEIEPNIVNRHVSLIDVPATLAEWMQLPTDGVTDGRNLTDLMQVGDAAISDEEDSALYAYEWYNGSWFGMRALRTPEYKYVWNPADARDELYDLVNDPGEMSNLYGNLAYESVIKDMRQRLAAKLEAIDDPALTRLRYHIEQEG